MNGSAKNICSLILLALALMLVGSGCARKTAGNLTDPTLASADVQAGDPGEVNSSPVAGEPIAESATATLSTADGRSLQTVYFDYDSYTLRPEAMQALEANAAWLQQNPQVALTIEGHCDERGSDEYNLALGERRAGAVRTYLAALGIAAERLETVSYGEERPAAAGPGEASWVKNRRAEFR